jgi:hypothetical protein
MSQQIPSLNWPRRTNGLVGTEDLLKQNPSMDSFPQEERIPVNLVSNYTLSKINLTNVGLGIGVFDFKNIGDFDLRSFSNGSNKVSVNLNSKTILLDVVPLNIAKEISISNLSDVNVVGAISNESILSYNTTTSAWEPTPLQVISPYTFNVAVNHGALTLSTISNGQNLSLFGSDNITVDISSITSAGTTAQFNWTANLNELSDVSTTAPINGQVLAYDTILGKWKPTVVSGMTQYSFEVKVDLGGATSTVNSLDILSILGNNQTITTSLTNTNEISIDWSANLNQLTNVSTVAATNGQVLTYNSSSQKWEPKNAAGANYTVGNGISFSGGTEIQLGGSLKKNTIIDGTSTYNLSFKNIEAFETTSNGLSSGSRFELNDTIILHEVGSPSVILATYMGYEEAVVSARTNQVGGGIRAFKLTTKADSGKLTHQLNNNQTIAGYIVDMSGIKILDGVNTPSAGHVLTYMSDGSTQFQPITGGGGAADNWGTQVVQHDTTLIGEGTSASLLTISNPLPTGHTDGDYLGVIGGAPTWLPPTMTEFAAICEVQADSEVSITVGKSFFVVPPQLGGWQIKNYIASVYTLGSGGTTDIRLLKNKSTLANSNLSLATQNAIRSSINQTVSAGDIINIEITGAKTTKDKGLSVTIYFQP